MTLTQHISVLKKAEVHASFVCFDTEGNDFESSGYPEESYDFPRSVFEEMGQPEVITLTVEPGDLSG